MKRGFLLVFALILIFAIMPISSTAASDSGLVWLIKPEFEYGSINYCKHCDIFKDKSVSEMRKLIKEYYYEDYNIVFLAEGHGYGTEEYFYDEEKNIIAVYSHNESGGGVDYYSFDEFVKNNGEYRDENWLIPVRKANSEKMIKEEHDDGGWIEFDENYVGDKYALFYDGKFITGFIYEDYEPAGYRYHPNDFIDLKLNGKWGIVDKTGKAAIQFMFDDIEFINDNIAFARYKGKYGILDFQKTIANDTKNPPVTGENNSIYLLILLPVSAVLIIKNKFYREKNL